MTTQEDQDRLTEIRQRLAEWHDRDTAYCAALPGDDYVVTDFDIYAPGLHWLLERDAKLAQELANLRQIATEYDAEIGRLKAENDEVHKIVDDYAAAARVIGLHLAEFNDETLSYDQMIAESSRRARTEMERLRAEHARLNDKATALAQNWRDYYRRSGHDYELSSLPNCADELLEILEPST